MPSFSTAAKPLLLMRGEKKQKLKLRIEENTQAIRGIKHTTFKECWWNAMTAL